MTAVVERRLNDGIRERREEALLNVADSVDDEEDDLLVEVVGANDAVTCPSAILCRNLATVAFCKKKERFIEIMDIGNIEFERNNLVRFRLNLFKNN